MRNWLLGLSNAQDQRREVSSAGKEHLELRPLNLVVRRSD